jgi:hypothetical protein
LVKVLLDYGTQSAAFFCGCNKVFVARMMAHNILFGEMLRVNGIAVFTQHFGICTSEYESTGISFELN